MSGFDYPCTCGGRHQYRDVGVTEKLARVTDVANNVNKYWRIVCVTTPCNARAYLTHSGRWTSGWRDRGQWKLQPSGQHAEHAYSLKVRGGYANADGYGQKINGITWTDLSATEDMSTSEKRRANNNALPGQSFLVALAQAQLLAGATPVAEKKPKPPALNGVDPLIELGRRTDTLVVKLSTSEFTVEMAAERAKLLAELASYRSRLEQVESTLDIATALIAR